MARVLALLPLLLLVVGAALVVRAIVAGTASFFLVVIIPVVAGGSLEFVVGVILLLAGLFTLPLAWSSGGDEDAPEAGSSGAPRSGMRSGGLLLVGPFPIFFGGMRPASS
ncbi:MAG: hypothetical protein ACREDK_07075, partial [Thermoplasmata archaeon]